MFPCLNLERNDRSFSDSKEKEGPPNKLVYCYEEWVLTMCQTLCCRALYCYSSIPSCPFFSLPFDPDSHSRRFTENQLCGATKPHTMDTGQIGQCLLSDTQHQTRNMWKTGHRTQPRGQAEWCGCASCFPIVSVSHSRVCEPRIVWSFTFLTLSSHSSTSGCTQKSISLEL